MMTCWSSKLGRPTGFHRLWLRYYAASSNPETWREFTLEQLQDYIMVMGDCYFEYPRYMRGEVSRAEWLAYLPDLDSN